MLPLAGFGGAVREKNRPALAYNVIHGRTHVIFFDGRSQLGRACVIDSLDAGTCFAHRRPTLTDSAAR
jgi:hypothetical protein